MIDKRKEKESDLVAQTPTGSDAACLLRGGGGGGCVGRPRGDLGGASTGPGEVPTLPTHHPPPLHVSRAISTRSSAAKPSLCLTPYKHQCFQWTT